MQLSGPVIVRGLWDLYKDQENDGIFLLYQPMTHISHKPIIIYMGGLILGVNTLYRLLCFFKLFPMVGKGVKLAIVRTCHRSVQFCIQTCYTSIKLSLIKYHVFSRGMSCGLRTKTQRTAAVHVVERYI